MSRQPRRPSESEHYHITLRGAGRRIIFEDDDDRRKFLHSIVRSFSRHDVSLYAWCLMDNHVHLLVSAKLSQLSLAMKSICTSYAMHFNGRYGHVGPVFQGRFGSHPVNSDSHLLQAMRYIHLNPRERNVDPCEYVWSSYQQYLGNPGICCISKLLDMLGGKDAFVAFHDVQDVISMVDITGHRRRLSDIEAKGIAQEMLGADFSETLALMPKANRDSSLRRLAGSGLSSRQIERLTGIGRGTIRKACEHHDLF